MISANRQVTSREYKLPLNTERFRARAAGTQAFWNLVVFLAGQQDLEVVPGDEDPDKEENPQGEEKRRTVQYLDTAGFELQRQGAIVRLRYESKEKKPYKVMLKYRSPDRYLAASRDVSCTRDVDERDLKFEEDILPPFISKFSASVSFKSVDPVAFVARTDHIKPDAVAGQLVDLFPGLRNLGVSSEAPIRSANGFKAHEVVQYIGKLKVADTTLKLALSHWYLQESEEDFPLVTEFSFDYDLPEEKQSKDKLEQFAPDLVRDADQLYDSLQSYTAWLSPAGLTKTRLAFESL